MRKFILAAAVAIFVPAVANAEAKEKCECGNVYKFVKKCRTFRACKPRCEVKEVCRDVSKCEKQCSDCGENCQYECSTKQVCKKEKVCENVCKTRKCCKVAKVFSHCERCVAICHIPPGNPANAHTIRVAPEAVPAHLSHGDVEGPCPWHDAGVKPDCSVGPDAGVEPDTFVEKDAGVKPDCSVGHDTGVEPDTFVERDAGLTPDSVVNPDAGPTPDAGVKPDSSVLADSGRVRNLDGAVVVVPDAGVEPDMEVIDVDGGECPQCAADEEDVAVVGGGGCNISGSNVSLGVILILGVLFVMRRRLITLLALAFLLAAPAVQAAPPVNTLKSVPTMYDYYNTLRPEVLSHRDLTARVVLRSEGKLLELETRPGREAVGDILRDRLQLDVGVAVGILDHFELGLVVPAVLHQSFGSRIDVLGFGISKGFAEKADLGDMRLIPKVHLGNLGDFIFGFALPISFPTGSKSSLTGEEGAAVEPVLLVGYNHKYFKLAANLGYRARFEENLPVGASTTRFDDELTFGLGVKVPLVVEDNHSLDFVGDLWGAMGVKEQDREEVPLETLLGLRLYTAPGLTAGLAGGFGLTQGYGTADWRVLMSVGFDFGAPSCPACQPVVEERVVEKVVEKIVQVVKVVDRVVVLPAVYFDTDKHNLRPDARDLLDKAVVILRNNPQITRVRVDGHCDRRASHKYNEALSQRRVQAVIQYLEGQGVKTRLVPKPLGERTADQKANTTEALQNDRRVDLVVVEVK